jgi:SpoVK/Ycf46/Vps4 family AAA+-type ATPase
LRGYIATFRAFDGVEFAGRPAYSAMAALVNHPDRVKLLTDRPDMTVHEARALMAMHKRAVTPVPTETEKLASAVVSLERAAKRAIKLAATGQSPEQKLAVDEMLAVTEKFKTTFDVKLPDVQTIRLTPEEIKTLLARPENDISWWSDREAAMRAAEETIARREKRLNDEAREAAMRAARQAEEKANYPWLFEPGYERHDPDWGDDLAIPGEPGYERRMKKIKAAKTPEPVVIDGLSDAQIVEVCEKKWAEEPVDYTSDLAAAR